MAISEEVKMQIFTRGKPSFDNLAKWEKEALINPLLDVIKEFYANDENCKAFEEWQKKKTNEKQTA